MPARKSSTFTEVELEFLQLFWEHGEMSTLDLQRSLQEQGRDLADGSIRKILSILIEKGHLSRTKAGRGFRYRPIIFQEQAKGNIIQDLLKRAFSGSIPGMVATLLNNQSVSSEEIDQIKKLIADYEKGDKK
jgi:BlaI family transcriptional regulator, penicillinase repressor